MGERSGQLSREEVARIEIGSTAITPGVARLMIVAFAAIILALPLMQAWQEFSAYSNDQREHPWPQAFHIVKAIPTAALALPENKSGLLRFRHFNATLLQEMENYEDDLEDGSLLRRNFLGPMQRVLLKLGAGNESTYPGRDGWLFYRPGLDYVTGPGFLDPHVLRSRANSGEYLEPRIQPDPAKAILQFHRELKDRGLELIVFPAPVKPTVHPEHFSKRYTDCANPLQNASYERLMDRLRAEGITVFDIAGELVKHKLATGEPQFLRTDTHWTPTVMELAAKRLAELIQKQGGLSHPPIKFARDQRDVSHAGDIAAMLNLPEPHDFYPLQTVTIHPVYSSDAQPWETDNKAEVLLLGDSFANIYSMKELGWGESAGLAEQLSFYLQQPIDRITQNDSGAVATRQTLARDIAQGRDPLRGKKFVVWEFAARELAIGNWKTVPLPDSVPMDQTDPEWTSTHLPEDETQPFVLEGTVRAVAGMPKPGTVPYRDGITCLHLVELDALRGDSPPEEVVVYLWGMRDNQLTDAARLKPGERIQLKLSPWSLVEAKYGTFTRVELDDPDFVLLDLPTFWGTLEPEL